MKKNKLIYIALCSIGFIACEPEFDQPLEDNPITRNSGEADFSKYISLGNSLTAGFADRALYRSGQENAFPNLLANQMKAAGGGDFFTPFMADDIGGFAGQETNFPPRSVFDTSIGERGAPVTLDATPTTDITAKVSGPINNFGVPGAKSFQLGTPLLARNPYYARFQSQEGASVIQDAASQQPTFFTLWIGNNDVLSYAIEGGADVILPDDTVIPTVNQAGNIDPSTYGPNDISDPRVVAGSIQNYTNALIASNANTKGVIVNIPNVSDIPFFTTVPNNALVLSAEQAAGLTGFFRLYANIVSGGLQRAGVPQAAADALASQYAITFNPGPNRFLIEVPADPMTNPQGFRQMTEEELLLLTIDQEALRTQGYGSAAITPQIAQILGTIAAGGAFNPADAPIILEAVNAIIDMDALDSEEQAEIGTAVTSYNTAIKQITDANPNLALLDANTLLSQLADVGLTANDGTRVSNAFASGGAFSLDGVHLTPRGNAFIANELIKVINTTFGSDIQPVNPSSFRTITLK